MERGVRGVPETENRTKFREKKAQKRTEKSKKTQN